MPIIKWDPFGDQLAEVDKWFAGFDRGNHFGFIPALDVYQDNDSVVVEAPLPGVNPDNVEVTVENNVLTIEGKSESRSEIDEKNYYRKEVKHGSFYRSVPLPAPVDGDKAEASFNDGVLKVVVPKIPEKKPKSIKIATNSGK